jgi:hypothetical protein
MTDAENCCRVKNKRQRMDTLSQAVGWRVTPDQVRVLLSALFLTPEGAK